jgi:hypothetical protein
MTIEQIVAIPNDYLISLELPRSIPVGVKARVKIDISAVSPQPAFEIEEVRKILQKEIIDKETSTIKTASGDGWETHVKERYAEP